MSIQLMSQVWDIDDSELAGSRLLLLLALADYANSDNICWPSYTKLAQRARVSERQVQRIVQWLVERGYIEIVIPGNGKGHSAHYRITPKVDTDVHLSDGAKVDTQRAKVDTQRAKVDIAMSTDPPEEPPIEPPEEEKPPLPPVSPDKQLDTEYAEIVRHYQADIGIISQTVGEALKHAQDDFPAEWIIEAIQESARYNKRSWAYAEKILNRWEREGRGPPVMANGASPPVTIKRVEGDAYL